MKRLSIILTITFLAVIAYSQESYTFTFQESDFSIQRAGDTIRIEPNNLNYNQTYEMGQPQLPLLSKRILNPAGECVDNYTVKVSKRVLASDVLLPAVDEPRFVGEETPMVFSTAYKSLSNAVELADGDCRHHGFSFSLWSIAPFLYDAKSRELCFIDSLTISPSRSTLLKTQTNNDGSVQINPRPDRMDWSGMENLQAQSSYRIIKYPNHPLGVTPGCEQIDYVIITADSLMEAYSPLIEWKKKNGLRAKVVSIESVLEIPCEYTRAQEKLKYYLYTLYQNNGLKWCLLGGDEKIIPVQYCYLDISKYEKREPNIPVDNYFACFENDFCWNANGNDKYGELDRNNPDNADNIDFTPEIHLSRLPVHTCNQIEVCIKKSLNYEHNPDKDKISKVLMAGATVGKDESDIGDSYKFMKQSALSIGRNKAQFSYLFDVYSDVEGESNLTSEALYNQINQGYNIIGIYTHGDVKGYLTQIAPRLFYTREHAMAQANSMGSIIMAISCETNEFDSSTEPCLSEALLRNPNGGAVAYLGWSRIAFISTAEKMLKTFFKELFKSYNSTNLAYISDQIRIQNLSCLNQNDYDIWTMYGFNSMGDPEMTIYLGKCFELDCNITDNRFIVLYNSYGDYGEDEIDYYIEIKNGSNESFTGSMEYYFSDDDLYWFGYYLDLPYCAYNAIFSNKCTLPTGLTYRPGETYILENTTISYNQIIRADSVIIGDNVTIIPNKTLTIMAKDNITFKSNVDCQKGAYLKLIYE